MDISIKLRGFILDKDSGCPLSGVVVVAVAEPDDNIKLPLGILVSDTAGYVSFDLKRLWDLHISIKHLWVYAIGDEVAKIDLAAGYDRTGSSEIGSHKTESQSPIGRLCFPFLLKVDPKLARRGNHRINLPSIHNPDLCDCELSPYSFSIKNDVLLGEAGCEVPVPSVEAEREYRFSQVVRTTILSPTGGSKTIFERAGEPAFPTGGASSINIGLLDPNEQLIPGIRDQMPITYGEVLEFRQKWIPAGHALGSIVYSLPLAPCESVNIAVIDWSRKDYIMRTDAIVSKESLNHSQRRDRIIDEAVEAAIKESQGGWAFLAGVSGAESAGASATVPAGDIPINISQSRSIVGSIGGGISNSWGNRDLTGQSIQQLHDSIIQATNATRSLNSTVIVQATQEESNYLETRTITNHNHCHALTVQYYEVLRRFKVVTEYVRSRRAVLVPYRILEFRTYL